jgi:3-phenylpropionate/cinnamic acid dioxygenase small subunit
MAVAGKPAVKRGGSGRPAKNVRKPKPRGATLGPRIDRLLLREEIESFLYREAALLDARRFDEWVALFADDLEYWMPVRTNRMRNDEANEFTRIGQSALFDDDKPLLEQRVRKLATGFAWAEDPHSRTRHFVANVRILEERDGNEFLVECAFLLHRSRLNHEHDLWTGRREDVLRRDGGGWKIARRHIFLDDAALGSKNLSVFF